MQVLNFYFALNLLSKILGSHYGTSALIPVVRTTQFNIILSEPPVIIIKMRANTRSR
jgi:hypothetical protein